MSWHPEHKNDSRQRILRAAGELFSKQGFDQVGINEVMQAAGMTRGAFYSHFNSKSQLYSETIRATAQRLAAQESSLEQTCQSYLSMAHRNSEQFQCPLAFLISDVAQRDELVRNAWTETFRGFIQLIQRKQQNDTSSETATNTAVTQKALQTAVMMIGGLAVARALNDDELAESLLASCVASIQTNK